jgi:hypothetical protein
MGFDTAPSGGLFISGSVKKSRIPGGDLHEAGKKFWRVIFTRQNGIERIAGLTGY